MRKGFTLLEVVIAVSVVSVGLVGALLLITRTVSQMNLFSSRLIASYLSQEGIEIVRNIRDTNWLEQATDPSVLWDEGLNTPACLAGCEADYITGSANDTIPLKPTLPAYGTGRLLKIDNDGFYNYSTVTDTRFKREITIVPTATTLTVTVETTWTEKAKSYSHKAQEVLYNWK